MIRQAARMKGEKRLATETARMDDNQPKRQFRLSTLLVAITLFCVMLAWLGQEHARHLAAVLLATPSMCAIPVVAILLMIGGLFDRSWRMVVTSLAVLAGWLAMIVG